MDIITIEKMDHLFWLGRYIERVSTTLKAYFGVYDKMIDKDRDYYKNICADIGIPDVYGSKEEFIKRYPYDANDPNSITSSLNRAYDNAIVMRDYIGTETMSYVQLAMDDMAKASRSDYDYADMQLAVDHIFSFWGCVDDMIDDEPVKAIMRLGKRYERIDLYLAFKHPVSDIQREFDRFQQRLIQTGKTYDVPTFDTFERMLNERDFGYKRARALFANMFNV